jgi:hypothetical protein
MPDKIQSYKAICRGGLQSSENHLDLAENIPGSATRLVNYEVSLFGGYRRINGYLPFDTAAAEVAPLTTEGPVLGIAIFQNDITFQTILIAARKNQGSATYSFFQHVPLSGWQLMTLPAGHVRNMSGNGLTVTKIRHDVFNFGAGNQIMFVDGCNHPIIFDGLNWKVLDIAKSSGHGGDQLIEYPTVVEVFKNHVFLGGDNVDRAVICYSAPNNPLDYTAASGAGQIPIGFDLVQFKPFRDNLFIFGQNGIKKVSADVSAGFVIDNVTSNVGCIARDSVLELGGDLVFLAPDGLRPVAGTSRIGDVELETISRPIQPILSTLSKDYDLDTLNGVVVRSKSQLRYFVGDNTVFTEDSYGIIGGLRSVDTSVAWEFGELVGIRASCCTSGFVGREEYVLHGDYDGKVYRQEVGNSFNGNPILAVFQTPYYDFGDTEVRKVMRTVNTFIRAEGPFEMNMAVSYDWDDPSVAKPSSYDQASSGAPVKYGRNIVYAGPNVVYGGVEKPIIVTQVQGSGFATQLTFVTLGFDAPYSLQGLIFEFSVSGRR